MKVVAIAIAGAAGALSRYGVGLLIPVGARTGFPLATFLVNVSGSFVAGVSVVLVVRFWPGNDVVAAAVLVGFLGAFTTFSTFTLGVQRLVEGGAIVTAAVYVVTSVATGVAAAFIGVGAGRVLQRALAG